MLSEQTVAVRDCGFHGASSQGSGPQTLHALKATSSTARSCESGATALRSPYPHLQPIQQHSCVILYNPFLQVANPAFHYQDAATSMDSSALGFASTPDLPIFSSATSSPVQVISPCSPSPSTSLTQSLKEAPIVLMPRTAGKLGLPKLLPLTDAPEGSILSPQWIPAAVTRQGTLRAAVRGLLPIKVATLDGQVDFDFQSASQLQRKEQQHFQQGPTTPRDVCVAAATFSRTAAAAGCVTTEAGDNNAPIVPTREATGGGDGCSCACSIAVSRTSKSDLNVNLGALRFTRRHAVLNGKAASNGFESLLTVPVSVANTGRCVMRAANAERGDAPESCNTSRTPHAMSEYIISSFVSSYSSGGYNGSGSLSDAESASYHKPSGVSYDDSCDYDSNISLTTSSSISSETRSAYLRGFLAGRGASHTHLGSPRLSHVAGVDGAVADAPYIRPPLPNPFAALLTQSAVVLEIGGLRANFLDGLPSLDLAREGGAPSAALAPGLPALSWMVRSASGPLARTAVGGGSRDGSASRRASLASLTIGRVLHARPGAVATVAAVTASAVLAAASVSPSSPLTAMEPRQDDGSAVRGGDGQIRQEDNLDLVDAVVQRFNGLVAVAAAEDPAGQASSGRERVQGGAA